MDKKRAHIPKPSLSVDMIAEILTWLPIFSLLRYKLVCKDVKAVIESEDFKLKHYTRSITCVWGVIIRHLVWRLGDACQLSCCSYQCLGIYYGMLVQTNVFRKKYRIWNPALHHVIQLPVPHEGVFGMFLSHIPSPGDFKLISLFDNGKEAGNGREILSLDGSANLSWRKLVNFPNLSQLGGKLVKAKFLSIGMIVHCILLFDNVSEFCFHILSIDILKEDFLGIISPDFQFPKRITIEPFLYKGELGFAQIVENGLQVYSLANDKEIVKKIVLPLNFMNYDLMIFSVEGSENFFKRGRQILVYDTELKRVTSKKTRVQLETNAFPYKPSLFAIKGMEPMEMIDRNIYYTELQRV